MEYSLRNVRYDELDWLYELNEESYRDVVVRQFGDWDEAFQQDRFHNKWRRKRPAKIITIGDDLIGVVILEQRKSYDWLEEILLKAKFRGQGIGTSMMERFIADARTGNRSLRLQVLHENHRAKNLYERVCGEFLFCRIISCDLQVLSCWYCKYLANQARIRTQHG